MGACGDGTPLSDADCGSGSFVAADRCFTAKAAACDCLDCPAARCQVAESDPAQVTCGAELPEADSGW